MIAYLSKGFYGKPVSYQLLSNKDFDNLNELNELSDSSKSINRFSPQATKYKKEEIYVLDIKDGQTIQSIALKYNCTLWELNRLNNLISSQDFYSLKEIKIPSTKDSYRSEILKIDGAHLLSDRPIFENGTIDKQPRPITLNNVELDENISKFGSSKSSVDTILSSPTFDANNFLISQSKKRAQSLYCGLKWIHMICILLLCLFLIPTIIIIAFLFYK